MSDKKILQVAAFRPQVNEAAVKMAEDMLERIKRGEIEGIGYAAACNDGTIITAFSRTERGHLLTSAMATLQWRFLASRNGDVETE